ncbi:MAG: ribosome recycling factor [Candidatus Cloacimonadales bacterium]
MQKLLKTVEENMELALDALGRNFGKLRTGKASPAVLDDMRINYYGTPTPIKQLANVTVPEPRTIVIQPWDKTILADVEKAILAANIGVTPDNDGSVIRLPFQALTEEKRKDIVKQVKKLGEEAKITIRNARRDANDEIKQMEKDSKISEDEQAKFMKDVQEITDRWIKEVDQSIANKEVDVLSV